MLLHLSSLSSSAPSLLLSSDAAASKTRRETLRYSCTDTVEPSLFGLC
eukprot:gene7512-5296_t